LNVTTYLNANRGGKKEGDHSPSTPKKLPEGSRGRNLVSSAAMLRNGLSKDGLLSRALFEGGGEQREIGASKLEPF